MKYEPKDTKVISVWNRLSPEAREAKLIQARKRLELIKSLDKRGKDESESAALVRLDIKVNRTTIMRWRKKYNEFGFDGLIDLRIGYYRPMSEDIKKTICALRLVDPNIDVESIVSHVKEHHDFKTSPSNVKRILRKNGLNRKPGTQKGNSSAGEQRLEFGGMKLLEAACIETGYVKALAEGVSVHVNALPRPEIAIEPDKSGRDKFGRITAEYNERYRKKEGDIIGPGFASVSEKRKDMDPARLEIADAKEETLERKLLALMGSPLIGSGSWDGMRISRADTFLKEMCGYPYMPATLDRFARELKYAGVANTLWEVHARFWFSESLRWGDERRAAVIYADGTSKPIWTQMFSQSTKVSQVGRTMPGLDIVAFHSGYGVPILMLSHSGRAPLVKVLPDAINGVERICESSSVGRIVVIDAEANSIPFLKGLEQGKPGRGWVTRLRNSWLKDKEILELSDYKDYRNGDRIRMGTADFNDPDGDIFQMRVIEIKRRTSEKVTYLGASMLIDENEWKTKDIADLYFDRWPCQEANFRAVNQAAGFKNVHGYGKQLVDNISVVTELDELKRKTGNAEERLVRQQSEMDAREDKLQKEKQILEQKIQQQETIKQNINDEVIPGKIVTPSLQKLVKKQQKIATEIEKKKEKISKCQDQCDKTKTKCNNTQARLDKYQQGQEKLESRKKIFAHDVELDSIFSLLKVGLVLMITYVLKEYFGNACMDALTFLERLATLPARLRITPDLEIVTFEYNRRDPDMMALLEKYCESINKRGLRTRSKRKLRIQIDPAPKPDRAPPDRLLCKSSGRFVR